MPETTTETDLSTIEYPNQTSQWGRTLIDVLNISLSRIEAKIQSVNDNIDEKFRSFKEDIESIKSTSDTALQLAEQNQKDIAELKEDSKKINDEVNYLKFTCDRLVNENKQLKQHTNKLENYSRRNNVVIRGIPESRGESNAECADKVKNILRTKLMIPEDTVRKMVFVRCHRLGGYGNKNRKHNQIGEMQQKRPIIVRFANHSDKSMVWGARGQFTDASVFISENYSADTEFKRRKLYAIYKKAKNMDRFKMKSSLNGDVLVLDSVRYTVDDLCSLPDELNPRQFSEKSSDLYLIFGGIHSDHNPFSNWFPCRITYKGHSFNNLEQAYQYAKATYAKDAISAMQLVYTTDPRAAKDIGSKVKGLTGTNWETDKYDIMKELVMIKFTENRDLKKELLDTGNKILAESGHDQHYAIGLPITSRDVFNAEKWSGKNKLGEILCNVRECILKK